MSLVRRRELVPASIRRAAVTGVVVLGAPLFIAGLAVAGVSIPETLRSPLVEAGLLTRDANEAFEAEAATLQEADRTARRSPTDMAAGRGSPDPGGEPGSRSGDAARRGPGGAAGDEGLDSAADRADTGTLSPSEPAPESEPQGPAAVAGPPAGSEGGGDAGDGGGTGGAPLSSPIEDGLDQVEETVDQLDDALGDLPPDETSDDLPMVGGSG
jgi:hypothetical protein